MCLAAGCGEQNDAAEDVRLQSQSDTKESPQNIAQRVVLTPADLGSGWRRGTDKAVEGSTFSTDAIQGCLTKAGLVAKANSMIRSDHDLEPPFSEGVDALGAVMKSSQDADRAFRWTLGPELPKCLRPGALFLPATIVDVESSDGLFDRPPADAGWVVLKWRLDDPRGLNETYTSLVVARYEDLLSIAY
jgi:hypothetical protein